METVIQEPFEIRFDTEASTIMNGIEVIQTEEFVMETLIQETFELKFDTKASTIMNGIEVIQTEEFVKINEEGDQALLRVIIPTELAIEKTFKITITACDDQILENDFQQIDSMNN